MRQSASQRDTFAKLSFAKIYPIYLQKVEKEGRSEGELQEVITWLTGLDAQKISALVREDATFETFLERATLHPNAKLITGVICGHRVEEIDDDLVRQVRYLDKLVDELAKGKKMEKILRRS